MSVIQNSQFADVDWQNVVVSSLIVDASVYIAFSVGGKSKDKNNDNNKDNK